jgi:hypothetical protein
VCHLQHKLIGFINETQLFTARYELDELNITKILIKALQNLYGNTAQVKIGNKLSHPFNVTKGLRQGCCISPTLFKIYMRRALEEWKRKCHGMGISLENTTLYTLQFANDQVVLAGDKEDLKYMACKLKETDHRRHEPYQQLLLTS